MESVASIENSGFRICNSNGYLVSVRFSTHSYCERYGKGQIFSEMEEREVNSKNAEIAVIDPNGNWVIDDIIEKLGLEVGSDGMVADYVTPDDISRIIGHVVAL